MVNLYKKAKSILVLILMFSWLFRDWLPIWIYQNLPLNVSTVHASNFPVVEATNTYQTNSTPTSHSVNLPASIQAGDLLLVVFRAGTAATATIPGDWSTLGSRSSTGVTYVWWKEASGSEGSTVTVTTSTTIRAAAVSYRISNWSGTPEIAFTGSNTNDPPSLSPSWGQDDNLWISGLTNRRSDSSVTAAPTDYSSLTTITQTSSTLTSRSRVSTAVRSYTGTNQDPVAFTTTGTIDNPHSFTIAVQPEPLSSIENSFQRKTWYDGTRYWRSFFDAVDQRIEFEYSLDGSSWTENTTARIASSSSDFSVEADENGLFVVYTASNDIKGRKANSYPGTSFGWDSEATVSNGTSPTDSFSYPTIIKDSSSYIWVASRYTNGNNYYIETLRGSAANTLPTDSTDDVHLLANQSNTNNMVYAILSPLASQDMYVTYVENGFIKGALWDNSDNRFEDENGDIYDGSGSAWLDGWENRYKITVSNTNIDSNLTHFPILLTLGSSVGTSNTDVTAIFDELGSNSQKIAVTKDDGLSQLYVEIETWDQSTEQAWLWVSSSDLVLSSSQPTVLYFYFDAAQSNNTTYVGNTNSSVAENVWDSNFKAVWHFSETTGTFYDSTANNNDSTSETVTARGYSSSCVIGRCVEFGGADGIEVVENNSLDVTSNVTFQAQIDPDSFGSSGYATIVDKDYDSGYIWYLYGNSGYENFWLWSNAGVELSANTTAITLNSLQGLATTYNMASGPFYINGASAGTDTSSAALGVNNNQIVLGNAHTANEGFDGHIDEIRISNTDRSSSWIEAEHYSQTDNLVEWSSTAPSGGYDLIDTTTNLVGQGISVLSDGTNIHLAYINNSGAAKYRQRTYSWQTSVTIDSNSANNYPTIAIDSGNNELYIFWLRSDNVYYKKGVSTFTSSDWDVSATTLQASIGTLYLSSGIESGGSNIFILWKDNDGLDWDNVALSGSVVSITITTDGIINYGVLENGDSINTVTIADTQTVQNDGNVTVDLNIKTVQPSGWTLGSTPGSNIFVYEFSTNSGSNWTTFTTSDSYQTLSTGVSASSTVSLDFRLTAPNPATDNTEKTITTTIQAVQN